MLLACGYGGPWSPGQSGLPSLSCCTPLGCLFIPCRGGQRGWDSRPLGRSDNLKSVWNPTAKAEGMGITNKTFPWMESAWLTASLALDVWHQLLKIYYNCLWLSWAILKSELIETYVNGNATEPSETQHACLIWEESVEMWLGEGSLHGLTHKPT